VHVVVAEEGVLAGSRSLAVLAEAATSCVIQSDVGQLGGQHCRCRGNMCVKMSLSPRREVLQEAAPWHVALCVAVEKARGIAYGLIASQEFLCVEILERGFPPREPLKVP
jgi:hypothetical protein